MIFNSLTFLVFFAIVMALHYAPFFSWHQKKINLMIASYLFYAAWNPPFVILLWVSTVVDWWAAQWMVRATHQRTRRMWMLTSVVVNLGMLGYFKYGGFLLNNFVAIAGSLGIIYHPPGWDIVLPVGISFYTFATLSYTLDVYLRRSKPAGRFLDYALFVTFFPHLVAGPIMRPTELVPQFEVPRRATGNQIFFGLALLTLGLFQKVVLADGFLAPVVQAVYDAPGKSPGCLTPGSLPLHSPGRSFAILRGIRPRRSASLCASDSQCPTISASLMGQWASPTFGGDGTSLCRAGFAIISTSRSAGTGMATRGPMPR